MESTCMSSEATKNREIGPQRSQRTPRRFPFLSSLCVLRDLRGLFLRFSPWLALEHHEREWGQDQIQRLRVAVRRHGLGVGAAAVAHVAAAVERGVAVEDFAIPALLGHADAIAR